MKFVDQAKIEVRAGHGGAGSRHFRREKFVPLGGPDGGNGGQGGSVILRADTSKHTLLDFSYQRLWIADHGNPGRGANKDGKAGSDLLVLVPVGTQVLSAEDDSQLIVDLVEPGQEFVLAKGGRGGKGNSFFKSPTNQAPEHAQPGEEGESGRYLLTLKLFADVGLVGFPNAGKSTLISRISAARPKIADYPFTTLVPNLGVVKAKGGRTFVVADIPGLIEGAHTGKGLGLDFLKHIERTRVLAYVIDPFEIRPDGTEVDSAEIFSILKQELLNYAPELPQRQSVIILTKSDLTNDPKYFDRALKSLEKSGYQVAVISAASGSGLPELIEILAKAVELP